MTEKFDKCLIHTVDIEKQTNDKKIPGKKPGKSNREVIGDKGNSLGVLCTSLQD
jgi:hypothetical protein